MTHLTSRSDAFQMASEQNLSDSETENLANWIWDNRNVETGASPHMNEINDEEFNQILAGSEAGATKIHYEVHATLGNTDCHIHHGKLVPLHGDDGVDTFETLEEAKDKARLLFDEEDSGNIEIFKVEEIWGTDPETGEEIYDSAVYTRVQ